MGDYNTVAQLSKAIDRAVDEILQDDSSDTIDFLYSSLSLATTNEVYSWPEGTVYKRRRKEGGLEDKRNYSKNVIGSAADGEITIEVSNDTMNKTGKYYIDEIIERGTGRGNSAFPRPFYDPAETIIANDEKMISNTLAYDIDKKI